MYCSPIMGGIPTQMPSYEVRNFEVFFGNQGLPDARWSDFLNLGHGYGKDGNHVFFMGQIMKNVDPFSFQVINDTYAKDYQYVFQYGQIITGLQSDSFQPPNNRDNKPMVMQTTNSMYPMHMGPPIRMTISEVSTHIPSYEVRDFKVFFDSQYVFDAGWIDFTDLGQGYGKDSQHVFFMGQRIAHAHSFSFEVLNQGYAKDKNRVFQNGQIIEGVKPIGFQGP